MPSKRWIGNKMCYIEFLSEGMLDDTKTPELTPWELPADRSDGIFPRGGHSKKNW